MDMVDLDEKLGVRVFAGMSRRLMSLGLIWVFGVGLPHETPIDWSLALIAVFGFIATGITLTWNSSRSVAHHHRLNVVALSMVCAYTAITATYIERGQVNNPAVVLFSVPVIFEAVARRGPVFLAIPMAFSVSGYIGAGLYLGAAPIQVLTDTWYVMGFITVVYLLVSFLVGEVWSSASIANAVARIGAVVANASSSADALRLAEEDILLITGASRVALVEAENRHKATRPDVGEITTFKSTGRQLVFSGDCDTDHVDTVSNLFQMLEQRQVMTDQLQAQTVTDPLTGVGNRRLLDSITDTKSGSLTAVMFDLDYFKQYNDDHGHGAGDQLLIEFANVLTDSVRGDDVLVRYGGEEFCMVLSCDAVTAAARVEAIRSAWADHDSGVTFSTGLAAIAADATLDAVIDRADAALYRAKDDGRNQSMVDHI